MLLARGLWPIRFGSTPLLTSQPPVGSVVDLAAGVLQLGSLPGASTGTICLLITSPPAISLYLIKNILK